MPGKSCEEGKEFFQASPIGAAWGKWQGGEMWQAEGTAHAKETEAGGSGFVWELTCGE